MCVLWRYAQKAIFKHIYKELSNVNRKFGLQEISKRRVTKHEKD